MKSCCKSAYSDAIIQKCLKKSLYKQQKRTIQYSILRYSNKERLVTKSL